MSTDKWIKDISRKTKVRVKKSVMATSSTTKRLHRETERRNKSAIISYDNAWTTGNVSLLKKCLSFPFLSHGHKGAQRIKEEAYVQSVTKFSADFQVVKFQRRVLLTNDDMVASAYTGQLFHRKSGAKIDNFRAINIYRLRRGKIVELWFGRDELAFYQGLGLVISDEEISTAMKKLNLD